MTQNSLKFISILTLLSTMAVQAHSTVTPTLALRSQGFHADRQRNVGMANHINLYNTESSVKKEDTYRYGTFDVAVGYARSFRSTKLARCLFGDDLICNDNCKNTIKVQGSGVSDRDAKAWLADYFYLNCEYDGSFSVNPRIQNLTVDFDFYLGLDDLFDGLYYRIYGPLNWTKWQTRFCVTDPATVLTTSCGTGYLTPSGGEVLLSSLADYFAGSAPASVDSIKFQGLRWAKMPACDQTKTLFAELRTEIGWNFLQRDGAHLGTAIHLAAPTGNRRRAEYVMNPVVGNGNHYEIGGTAHGHYVFWRSKDEESHIGFYFDAVLTHLFKAREERTFDLCDKPNSRYMLAAKFTPFIPNELNGLGGVIDNGTTGSKNFPIAQFHNVYAPVANLTTTDLEVNVGIQADVIALFNFTRRGFAWDIGYNFWGRSCESFQCPTACNACSTDSIFDAANAETWGLKGDARIFGFLGSGVDSLNLFADDPVPLSATQNSATIHAGTNAGTIDADLTSVTLQNGGVDNAQFAIAAIPDPIAGGGIRIIHTPLSEGGFNINANQIKTSIQPIFLESTDVDLHETKGLSHTIFTHLSYTWDRGEWQPYFGVGGSAEFGKNDSKNSSNCSSAHCTSGCSRCSYCSLSQWSVWVKGGISFS